MTSPSMQSSTRVILIGGAPGAGKTTLGAVVARSLGFTSLTVDDLVSAAQAVTTRESHHGLHIMRRLPYLQYFTKSTVDQLKADAHVQHEATWPMVEAVVRKRLRAEPGLVLDGWHLRPAWVAKLNPERVRSFWIVPSTSVLE